jgi:hypothetical protein
MGIDKERNIELWVSEKIECYLCGHSWIAVYIYTTERLECPKCHNMIQYDFIDEEE